MYIYMYIYIYIYINIYIHYIPIYVSILSMPLCIFLTHIFVYYRYASAAQELVMFARGILKKGWRTENDRPASGDDISCFVIPLNQYCNMDSQSSSTESSVDIT